MPVSSYPPVFVRFSLKTQTSYHTSAEGGLVFTPRMKKPTQHLLKTKRTSTNCYASSINNTHGPQTIPGTSFSYVPMHMNFLANVEAEHMPVSSYPPVSVRFSLKTQTSYRTSAEGGLVFTPRMKKPTQYL